MEEKQVVMASTMEGDDALSMRTRKGEGEGEGTRKRRKKTLAPCA